ncbi:MAG: PAS domain S-box protein [Bryobacterales bacterium]|nr:PAS domain S-box protein [Bryobacterales bacterium]
MRDSVPQSRPPLPVWAWLSLGVALIFAACAVWLAVVIHQPAPGEARRLLMIDKLDSIERALKDLEQASATSPPVSLIGQDQAIKQWAEIYLNYRRQVKALNDDSQFADYTEIQDQMRNAYALENRSEQIRKEIIRGRLTAEQAKGPEAEFRASIDLAIAEIKGAAQRLRMPAEGSSSFPKAAVTAFLFASLLAAAGLIALLLSQPKRDAERRRLQQSLIVSQRSLQECENRSQAIFQSSQEGLVLMDDKGYIQQFSPAAEKLFGVSSVDIIGQSLSKLLPALDRTRFEDQLRKLTPTRDVSGVEVNHLRPDGGKLKLEMSIRKSVEGRMLIAAFRDMTARAAGDETLRHDLAFLAAVLDATRSYVVILDRQARVLRCNRASEMLAGRSSLDLQGRHFAEIFTPRDVDAVRAIFQKIDAGQVPANVEQTCPSQMGERVVAWASALLRDAGGKPEFVVVTGSDVTGIRREAPAKAGRDEVHHIAGELAFNLGNLLTNVSGYADLVLAAIAPDDPNHADVQQIKDSGERAATIVRKLLSFTGRNTSHPKALDLNATASAAAKMAARLGKDIKLRLELAPHPPQALADAAQLTQIIGMLFDNAREAMPAGGQVVVRTGVIGSAEGGDLARLSVSDSGRGMSPNELRRLFQPFFTTKDPGKGSGLSLAAARGMIEQAGGMIRASAEPGKGTTIEILLPLTGAGPGPRLVEKSANRR